MRYEKPPIYDGNQRYYNKALAFGAGLGIGLLGGIFIGNLWNSRTMSDLEKKLQN